MKVLFICPPNYRFREVTFQDFGLGPAYLAAVLQPHHDLAFYEADAPSEEEIKNFNHDYTSYEYLQRSHGKYLDGLQNHSHFIWKEVSEVIRRFDPDVVGLSTMTPSYPAALIIAGLVKRLSRALVLFGGVHASVLPEEVVADPHVDFVIRGEGENTIVELLESLEKKTDPAGVKGITYKREGKIVSTPDRELIKNLDSIPFPMRSSLLFPERFAKRNYVNVLAGRGCPHSCHYCANPVLWGRKFRVRSAQNVIDEVAALYQEYDHNVLFWDDNLLAAPKMLFEFCSKLKKKIPDILWRCQSRVDTLSVDKLLAMKDAGCWDVKLGLESGSDTILAYINKKLTTNKIMKCTEMIQKTGMQFSVNFMFGFPEETWEDLQATFDMIRKIPANSIAISRFIPLPGTKFFNDVVKMGMIDSPPKYEHFDLFSNYYHYSKNVSREKLHEFSLEIHRAVEEKNKKTRIGPPK